MGQQRYVLWLPVRSNLLTFLATFTTLAASFIENVQYRNFYWSVRLQCLDTFIGRQGEHPASKNRVMNVVICLKHGSMGPFCVTRSNRTHQLTDSTQPNPLQVNILDPTRSSPIQLTNLTA